jgi:hypothetical protein
MPMRTPSTSVLGPARSAAAACPLAAAVAGTEGAAPPETREPPATNSIAAAVAGAEGAAPPETREPHATKMSEATIEAEMRA